jgi:hypothetical protein
MMRQMHLQIQSWTALRSLGPEFFTGYNGISTGVDITFFLVIVPKKMNIERPTSNVEWKKIKKHM